MSAAAFDRTEFLNGPAGPHDHAVTVNALNGMLLARIGGGDWWGRPRVVLVDTLDKARGYEPKPAPRHRADDGRAQAAANRATARARDIEAGIIRGEDLIDGIGREFRKERAR